MTSAEHKTAAENLLAHINAPRMRDEQLDVETERNLLLEAQVHATLATIPNSAPSDEGSE